MVSSGDFVVQILYAKLAKTPQGYIIYGTTVVYVVRHLNKTALHGM